MKDWDIQINYGIKTGFNDAFIISSEKREEILAACKSDEESKKTDEIIRPILRGKDIKRFGYQWADLWLINTHNGLKSKNIPRIDIEDYPAIRAHLDNFWNKIEPRTDQGDTPYNLRNCAYMEEFLKPKIAWNRIASEKLFSLVAEGVLIQDSMHFLTGKHLQYLSSILNSKLFRWLIFSIIGDAAGGNAGNADNVKNLFIPKPNYEIEQQIKILLEGDQYQEIDKLIYKLYALSSEEIEFIETV